MLLITGTVNFAVSQSAKNLCLYSSSSTKVLATSGHSRGSSSSNSAQPMTAQDMHDTVDELQQEMAKQLSRGGCECLEESGSGTEQGSDDDDDDDDKEEESDSDDTDHEYANLLHYCV